jgi:ABC-2 type transport system permease protein
MKLSEKTKRRFRYGTNSIVLTVVVIVVAVIVNVVLESLPLTIDLTEQKLYSLTKDSIRLLDNIEKEGKEVEITALYDRVRGEADSRQSVVIKMLDKYDRYSNITVKYVDTDKNPAYVVNTVGQERASEFSKGDYIVKSGDKIKRISSKDMFVTQMDLMSFSEVLVGYSIEKSITSAILYVTSEEIPKIYFSTGFGERNIAQYSELKKNIEFINFEVDTIDLSKDDIPEDATILMFLGPKQDLSLKAYENLSKWFDEGGHHAVFMMDYDISGTKFENFNKIFDMFNLRINNDVVFESPNYHLSNLPMRFDATTKTAGALSKVPETKIKVFETRTIEVLSRTNDYVKADAIVVSSPEAKAVPIVEGSNLDENKGIVGTHVLAASATYTRPTSSSKILLTGSSLNVRDDYVSVYSNTAGSVVLYTLQWMHSSLNEGDYIPVVSASSGSAISVTDKQKDMLGIFSIIAWPACILIVGGVVWFRRRHL